MLSVSPNQSTQRWQSGGTELIANENSTPSTSSEAHTALLKVKQIRGERLPEIIQELDIFKAQVDTILATHEDLECAHKEINDFLIRTAKTVFDEDVNSLVSPDVAEENKAVLHIKWNLAMFELVTRIEAASENPRLGITHERRLPWMDLQGLRVVDMIGFERSTILTQFFMNKALNDIVGSLVEEHHINNVVAVFSSSPKEVQAFLERQSNADRTHLEQFVEEYGDWIVKAANNAVFCRLF